MRNLIQKQSADLFIKQSENNIYRAIFEHTGTAMAIVEADTTLKLVNSEFERLSGYSKEELEGKRSWQIFVGEDELQATLVAFNKVLTGDSTSSQYEFHFNNRNGQPKYVFITHALIPNTNQVIASLIDISDRKTAEGQLLLYKQQLQDLSAHVQMVYEQEKRQTAQDIHDELGQALTGIKIFVSMIHNNLPEMSDIRLSAIEVERLADNAIEFVQSIYTSLHPRIVEDLGLTSALEFLFEELKITARFEGHYFTNIEGTLKFKPDRAIILYRIFQEAMTNAIRHAKAKNIDASLKRINGSIVLRVCDDGCGIPEEKQNNSRSFGLLGMRERAISLGGILTINTDARVGTLILVKIPLKGLKSS